MNIERPVEHCAVFGISTSINEAGGITYNALLSMQHRGQEGAGIAVLSPDGKLLYHKGLGLVSEVFDEIDKLPKAHIAIGHVRYSTTGSDVCANVQPFVAEYLTGRIAAAHNGNVTNAKELREQLTGRGVNFSATSDSEVVSSLIGYFCVTTGDPVQSVKRAAAMLEGAFCLVVLTGDGKLIAVRDAHGYRPLCIGENEFGMCVASESCGAECSGFNFKRNIAPGEIVVIREGKEIYSEVFLSPKDSRAGMCVFEFVYFARTDSVIDGQSVFEARHNMGRVLAREYPVDADVVCGVPDSGLDAAIGYSAESKIPLVTGFVKNRYIGRSFIYPSQLKRENAVNLKLHPLKANIEGKKIVLIDDSIVRGTTSERIVRSLKDAGAKEVHMRISSPPFKYACHYGTDIDDESVLIANKKNLAETCRSIGADSLGYISVDGLKSACGNCRLGFCTKCFTGRGNAPASLKNSLE